MSTLALEGGRDRGLTWARGDHDRGGRAVPLALLHVLVETVQLLINRNQDVTAQQHELEILEPYLPRQMTESDLEAAVRVIVTDLGVNDAKVMGQVMAELKARHAGTYDGKLASQVVKSVLA